MTNTSYVSRHAFRDSRMNESWSTASTLATTHSYGLAYVEYLHTFPTLITTTIFNIVYAFGILGNILLLVYLIYYERYKTPVFCAILSMGVADLCVCVSVFLRYSCVFPYILGPVWLCKVVSGLMSVSCFVSSYHISAFAVLRFIQLVYPLTSHVKVTTSLLSKVCLTIWDIYSVDGVVMTRYHEAVNISPIESSDIYVCRNTLSQHGRYVRNIWIIIVWMFVPFITTSGFHVAKQIRVILSHSTTVTSHDARGQNVRIQTDARALAMAIVIYLCTMFPFLVQGMRLYVVRWVMTSELNSMLYGLFGHIALTNSAVNPCIYLFAAESVRSDIRRMITSKK